jgi:hypothetical protein
MSTTCAAPFPDPQPGGQQIDPILIPYVTASDEDDARTAAEEIFVRHTIPDVDRIIGFKTWSVRLDAQAASDLKSEVHMNLWIRLRKCREGGEPIRRWSDYVHQTSYNVWRTYLRHKRPAWHRLKNRIRYVLRWDDELALWQSDNGEWWCGLARWRSRPAADVERVTSLVNGLLPINAQGSVGRSPKDLAGQLRYVFRLVDGPVDLDTVVGVLVRIRADDYHLVSAEEPSIAQSMAAGGAPIDEELARRELLEWLWTEICTLPLTQRNALLLNLRGHDGLPAIELVVLAGVVTLAEVGHALGFSPDDFARLWPHLPLDDATIGSMIGKTRQQVINLRKSARDRLKRRIRRTRPPRVAAG